MTAGARSWRWKKLAGFLTVGVLIGGCAQVSQQQLNRGYSALSAKDYDTAQRIADAEIQKDPNAQGIAEAYYLRGQALENRPAHSAAESAQLLRSARLAYEQCLAKNPSTTTAAYARASIGSVAFFQDDYAKASEASEAAYNGLDRPTDKAIVLLRAAQSYQRLGQFGRADAVYAELIRRHPGTPQARAAAADRGARAFYLQLAAVSDPLKAAKAEDEFRRLGFRGVSSARAASGMYQVRVGPYPSYLAARAAKEQVRGRFPDAIVQP